MIQQYIKGKTKEEIKDILKGLSNNELIKKCIIYQLFEFLPRNKDGVCVYNGDLTVGAYKLTALPNNLRVIGYLYCADNDLTTLPNNLTVEGHLYCYNNNLIKLPDDLIVHGFLNCSEQKSGIKLKLPKTAVVKIGIEN